MGIGEDLGCLRGPTGGVGADHGHHAVEEAAVGIFPHLVKREVRLLIGEDARFMVGDGPAIIQCPEVEIASLLVAGALAPEGVYPRCQVVDRSQPPEVDAQGPVAPPEGVEVLAQVGQIFVDPAHVVQAGLIGVGAVGQRDVSQGQVGGVAVNAGGRAEVVNLDAVQVGADILGGGEGPVNPLFYRPLRHAARYLRVEVGGPDGLPVVGVPGVHAHRLDQPIAVGVEGYALGDGPAPGAYGRIGVCDEGLDGGQGLGIGGAGLGAGAHVNVYLSGGVLGAVDVRLVVLLGLRGRPGSEERALVVADVLVEVARRVHPFRVQPGVFLHGRPEAPLGVEAVKLDGEAGLAGQLGGGRVYAQMKAGQVAARRGVVGQLGDAGLVHAQRQGQALTRGDSGVGVKAHGQPGVEIGADDVLVDDGLADGAWGPHVVPPGPTI